LNFSATAFRVFRSRTHDAMKPAFPIFKTASFARPVVALQQLTGHG
jgi:hypothetical protein